MKTRRFGRRMEEALRLEVSSAVVGEGRTRQDLAKSDQSTIFIRRREY